MTCIVSMQHYVDVEKFARTEQFFSQEKKYFIADKNWSVNIFENDLQMKENGTIGEL